MNKVFLAFIPIFLFASDANTETDIVERSVNFIIFAAIIYYLLSDKIKNYLAERRNGIQKELDKVQLALEASKKKVDDANAEIEHAKKLAEELVTSSENGIKKIEDNINATYENEINNIKRIFDEKLALESKKAKRETVEEVLHQLLSKDNISINKDELSAIILRKVA